MLIVQELRKSIWSDFDKIQGVGSKDKSEYSRVKALPHTLQSRMHDMAMAMGITRSHTPGSNTFVHGEGGPTWLLSTDGIRLHTLIYYSELLK